MARFPDPERLAHSVDETARMLGISRNAAYEAVARGDIPSLRIGKRIVIPRAAIDDLLMRVARKAA